MLEVTIHSEDEIPFRHRKAIPQGTTHSIRHLSANQSNPRILLSQFLRYLSCFISTIIINNNDFLDIFPITS